MNGKVLPEQRDGSSLSHLMKSDIDSIRRTNLNIMERLISSAQASSDKTLGAMYTVMGLSHVSGPCRRAYPWLHATL